MLDLQRAQIEKSAKEQELLAPILYKQLGITPKYGEDGKITGFEENPLTKQYQDVERQYLERSQAALKGELPVNPGLMTDLTKAEADLKERLFRQLGPGWETSTPGIEALGNFSARKNETLDAARRGDLTMAQQLGIGANAMSSQNFGNVFQAPNAGLAGASAGAGVASGYGAAANALSSDRLAQYQGSLQSYQNDSNTFGKIVGGVGQLAGVAGGIALSKWWK